MKQLFSNNARTTVASTFGAADTTLEVLDGSLFPVPNEAGQFFLLTLLRIDGSNQEVGHEVIKCNARVGNTITVEQRAYEGAAASEFAVGAVVSARLTAKSMENLIAASIAAVELIYDNFDDRYLGAKEADPLTDNDGDPLEAGMLYFNTTALIMRVHSGAAWQDAASAIEGLGQTFQFTATEGQAEFSGNDDSGAELTFDSVGNIMVFLNGVRLVRSIDYTVNDTTKTITLIKPAADLDVLTVDAFSYFATVPLADKAMAESGTDNASLMTPLRTAQAINAMPRKNFIINGNFDIWQRGVSQTLSGYGSDDRWLNNHSSSTKTHSRQEFDIGQTGVPGNPRYYSRTVVSSVIDATANVTKQHRIEDVRSFAGETITLSFYARADAVKNIAIEFQQNFGTGGAPSASVVEIGSQLIPLATSFSKYTVTVDIPSIVGKILGTNNDSFLQLILWFDAGSDYAVRTAGLGQQSGTFDIAQVQLEKGSVATDFEYRPIGEELALCQRYYSRPKVWFRQIASNGGQRFGIPIIFPVEMRAPPTMSASSDGTYNNATEVNFANQSTVGTGYQIDSIVAGDTIVFGRTFPASAEL